jgi:hypothetical protein
MGTEDGTENRGRHVESKKARLQDAILFSIVKNRNIGVQEPGLKKRDIKKDIGDDFPESLEYTNYFEDAFEILTTKNGRNLTYLKRIKGYSYTLNEEIADKIIQDYRVASLLVNLVNKYDDKSFSYNGLKKEFAGDPYFEILFDELKRMRYVVNDKILKGEYYFIVLAKYKKEKLYLEMIIKEKIRKI